MGENSRWVVLEVPSNATEAEDSKGVLGSTAKEEAEAVPVQNRVVEVVVESVGRWAAAVAGNQLGVEANSDARKVNWSGIETEGGAAAAEGQNSTRDDTIEPLFVHAQLVVVPGEAVGWSYNRSQ